MDEYIGISENKLHHILGVARKCYKIAKEEGYDEDFCRRMFMIGWNHDVGYEFAKTPKEHPEISSEMIHQMIYVNDTYDMRISLKTDYAIYYHGKYPNEDIEKNAEWRILNTADMLIDSKGNEVDVMDRLNDIKERYGEHSDQYLTSCDICYRLGLTSTNLAALID